MVSRVSSPMATWTCLVLLLSIHLAMNHAAVKAVSMHTLNRQRANIVLSNMFVSKRMLSPEQVSKQERIFERDGILRWQGTRVVGYARIGVPLTTLLKSLSSAHPNTSSHTDPTVDLASLYEVFGKEEYMLWFDSQHGVAFIVLKDRVTPPSQLKAWAHALWMAHHWHYHVDDAIGADLTAPKMLQLLRSTLEELTSRWDQDVTSLTKAGWDIETPSLETTSATRIHIPVA